MSCLRSYALPQACCQKLHFVEYIRTFNVATGKYRCILATVHAPLPAIPTIVRIKGKSASDFTATGIFIEVTYTDKVQN